MVSDGVIHACAGGAGGMVSMTATYPLVSISMRAAVDRSKDKQKVRAGDRSGAVVLEAPALILNYIVPLQRAILADDDRGSAKDHQGRRDQRTVLWSELVIARHRRD